MSSPTSSPTAAAIICCYTDRRYAEILAAVASVAAQTSPAAEILLVVDHDPGLRERLTADLPRTVRILDNAHAQGLTGARNTGVEAATADVVAFLDDDAVADPGWLAAMLPEYADPRVVAVGGRIDPVWTGGRPSWFPDEFGWVVGCSYRGQPTRRAVVRNVIGANMSFRRSVIDEVGGFRTELGRIGTLPVGCEETELCIRATTRTGGVVVFQPAAIVGHHVSPDRGTWAYLRSRCWSEGTSKAIMAGMTGSDKALATERTYVTRTLPSGVLRALATGAFPRALAIVLGFTLTLAGYVTTLVRARVTRADARARKRPFGAAPSRDDRQAADRIGSRP